MLATRRSPWEHPLPPGGNTPFLRVGPWVGPCPQPLAVTREHAGTLSCWCERRVLRPMLARPSGLGCIDLFL